MQQVIYIDAVQPQDTRVTGVDLLEIEWFEIEKHLFKRSTLGEKVIHLERESNRDWQQGDALYSNGKLIAQLEIKPALAIQFTSTNGEEIADFSFYIGNRHLPVFIAKEGEHLLVPYDGNLYEQLLAKFPTQITLEKKQLLACMLLKKKYSKP